jgi:3-hydroxyisobutyrate dehydrogenase
LKITVIGLGQMGGNMALTLLKKGFSVNGIDPVSQTRERLAQLGLTVSGPESLPPSDVYLLSLPTSAHVEDVIQNTPNLLANAPKGSVIVDMSTSDPASTRTLATLVQDAGLHWLDAPVSGGPAGAAAGTLGILLGGDAAVIARIEPVLKALSAKYTHVGGAGAGHVVKLANNFLCAAHLISTAQAVAMAQQAGVDPSTCLEGINSGSGRSGVSEVNFPKWVLSNTFDSGFTMGLMRKDLRLARDFGAQAGVQGGIFDAVMQTWHNDSAAIADSDDFNRIITHFLKLSESITPEAK